MVDVGPRNVVLGVERPFPHVARLGGVEDNLTRQRGPHAPGTALDVVDRDYRLRVVDRHDQTSTGGHRTSAPGCERPGPRRPAGPASYAVPRSRAPPPPPRPRSTRA